MMNTKSTKQKGATATTAKRIGIVLYPSFDSLDVIGAHQVFHYATGFHEGSEVLLIGPSADDMGNSYLQQYRAAASQGLVLSGEGVKLAYDCTYADYLEGSVGDLDVVYVPGAMDTSTPLYFSDTKADNPFFLLLEKAQKTVEVMASVCTGALLLGAGGYLAARKATTHWQVATLLAQFPEVTVVDGYPRYVVDQNIVTGGGISSTIDEALAITTMIFDQETAEKAQLIMQYHPQPPVQAGDPEQASPRIVYETSKQDVPYQPGFITPQGKAFLYYLEHGTPPSN